MSLINQVLNDLDKRGASTRIGEATIRVVPIRQRHGTFWLFVAAVSVAALAATAWLKWGTEVQLRSPSVARSIPSTAQVGHPASQPAATATAEVPAELTAPALHLSYSLSTVFDAVTVPLKPPLLLTPSAAKGAQRGAKPASAGLSTGGVSKQPTQITTQQQAENEYRKAYGLMQQGQITAAISGLETAIQLDAGHTVARQTLVRLLLDNKRNADAERVLQEGLKYDPKQSGLAMLLARMQVDRNELPQALDTMQKSLPYAHQQADYQAFVAALMQRQNRHKEAISYYQNALQLNPQSGVWLMGLGISLRAEQRDAEARDAFNRAMGTHNLSPELQSYVTQQLKEL